MIALQNVQNIFIRATYNYPSRGDTSSLQETSIDVAVWDNTASANNYTAIGVETCECPQGYTGNSCQDPAESYCRKRQPDFLNSQDDLSLVGAPQPCVCNGHSVTCEPETCRCTNCEHNTFGDFCNYCKPGYHGDPSVGDANACTKCACPLLESSFSETCVAANHGRGYICNACKTGYTGMYCESCSSGYFGNPNVAGGRCEKCACHSYGSANEICDQVSGQCECHSGVTGRDCSLCQPRHAFIGGICTSCDQGCTRDLMLEVDEIEHLMGQQNFSSLRPIPWKRLARINSTEQSLSLILESVGSGNSKDAFSNEGESLNNKYLLEVNGIVEQSKYLLERSNRSKNMIQKILEGGEKLSMKTKEMRIKLRKLVDQLSYYIAYGGIKQDSLNVNVWINESIIYLNAINERDVYIDKRYNRGVIEYNKSKELLKAITSHKLNDTAFDELRDHLSQFQRWLDDYRNSIWDNARQDTISANRISMVVAKRIDRFNDVSSSISDIIAKAHNDIAEAENQNNLAKMEKILNSFDDFEHVKTELLSNVQEATQQCRSEADKYGQILSEYRREYVDSSNKHASNLEKEANRLQNIFVDTKMAAENPLKASNAYNEITAGLRNASKAANKANKAAQDAYLDADPSSSTSMVNAAQKAKNLSETIKLEAFGLGFENVEEEQRTAKAFLNSINASILTGQKRKSDIAKQFESLDDQHYRMVGLFNVTAEAEERAAEAKIKVDKRIEELNDIKESVSKLEDSAGQGVRSTIDDVRKAGSEVKEALSKLNNVQKQSDDDTKRITDLAQQILLLQQKIKEAREKASQIRISMKSDETSVCRRSFFSPAHPAPTNTFSLKYRPLEGVPNSLIFVTKTKAKRTQPAEFIAMELRNGRIVVYWNIGSGVRRVTNTHPIRFIASSDRTTWYNINLERIGNAMSLTVAKRRTTSGESERTVDEPITVTVGMEDNNDNVIFNTIPHETKIHFGCDAELAKKLESVTNKFFGTVGEFTVDDVTLPLWAFAKTEGCDGDFATPITPSTGYMFRDGFAQIRLPSADRPSVAQIAIVFSAYSPNGLVYFRGNEKNTDFICIELRQGHVVLKINLGGESYATLQSKRSYNDGRTHNIRAIRKEDQLHLQVDNETDRASVTILGTNTELNVNDNDHFVGGVSPDFRISAFERFDIQWNGFFGCIQSVKPSQVSELDLDNPIRSQGKQQGCTFKNNERLEPTDRIVGFSKPGFLITQGVQLTDNSTFAFSFRTRTPNATLIFQSSKLLPLRKRRETLSGELGYMAFYLYRGFLAFHLGTDPSQRSKVLTLRSETMYNDGQLHSVFFSRQDSLVHLRVDDREIASGTLTEQETIGSSVAQMFIGGFPDKIKPSASEMPMIEPMIGCVSNIFSNYRFVPIIPELYIANIGNCSFDQTIYSISPEPNGFFPHDIVFNGTLTESKTEIPLKSTKKDDVTVVSTRSITSTVMPGPKQCGTKIKSVNSENGAQFGISEASHSRLNFENAYPDVNQFIIQFAFRTTHANGVIWVWANYKNYTRYFILSLVDGCLQMKVKGHKQPKILNYKSDNLSDNNWHNVEILKRTRELTIKVDAYRKQSLNDVPNAKVMRKRMYVGGILSRHRKLFDYKLPGFFGCIRDFVVDNQKHDLFISSRDIVPCSSAIKSVYVHDGGYMIFDPLKNTGKHGSIEISLQFRPGIATGLIFGLMTSKDAEKTRIVFYMMDGYMIFELVVDEERRDLKHPFHQYLCDNRWHNITVKITAATAIVGLDKDIQPLPTKISAESVELFRSLPVYVGGVNVKMTEAIKMPSMVGCFQKLRLSNKPIHLTKAKKLFKTAIDSCPYSG